MRTSTWKNTQGKIVGGIGILLFPRAADNLLSLTKVSNRIIVAEFNYNPRTNLISWYSPTTVSDEDDVNDFSSSFTRIVLNIPAHIFLIISGDFNAKIGLDNVKFSFQSLHLYKLHLSEARQAIVETKLKHQLRTTRKTSKVYRLLKKLWMMPTWTLKPCLFRVS